MRKNLNDKLIQLFKEEYQNKPFVLEISDTQYYVTTYNKLHNSHDWKEKYYLGEEVIGVKVIDKETNFYCIRIDDILEELF